MNQLTRSLMRERWRAMIRRTSEPNHSAYADYGGRGIKVCERWLTFENFLADMGPTYCAGLTLDRIDVNGDYEPDNCRWATTSEQMRNRRDSRVVTWLGRTMHVSDWAERMDVSAETLSKRLRRGWPVGKALSEPAQQGKFPVPGQRTSKQAIYLKLLQVTAELRSLVRDGEMSGAVRQQLTNLLDDLQELTD